MLKLDAWLITIYVVPEEHPDSQTAAPVASQMRVSALAHAMKLDPHMSLFDLPFAPPVLSDALVDGRCSATRLAELHAFGRAASPRAAAVVWTLCPLSPCVPCTLLCRPPSSPPRSDRAPRDRLTSRLFDVQGRRA